MLLGVSLNFLKEKVRKMLRQLNLKREPFL